MMILWNLVVIVSWIWKMFNLTARLDGVSIELQLPDLQGIEEGHVVHLGTLSRARGLSDRYTTKSEISVSNSFK